MIRLLTHNLGWKLFSLALAAGLWAVFVGSPELTTSISAPIEYQNIPKNLEWFSEAPERVRIEVAGPSAKLHSSDLSQTTVLLNLSSVARPGERTFNITRDKMELPAGIELVRAVPSQIRIQFDRRVSRDVPVQPRYANPPPHGYRVRREEIRPDRLTIVGPESRVQQIHFVETDPIDLTQVVGEAQFRVNAWVGDPRVRFESLPAVVVRVFLEKIAQRGGSSGAKAAIRH